MTLWMEIIGQVELGTQNLMYLIYCMKTALKEERLAQRIWSNTFKWATARKIQT